MAAENEIFVNIKPKIDEKELRQIQDELDKNKFTITTCIRPEFSNSICTKCCKCTGYGQKKQDRTKTIINCELNISALENQMHKFTELLSKSNQKFEIESKKFFSLVTSGLKKISENYKQSENKKEIVTASSKIGSKQSMAFESTFQKTNQAYQISREITEEVTTTVEINPIIDKEQWNKKIVQIINEQPSPKIEKKFGIDNIIETISSNAKESLKSILDTANNITPAGILTQFVVDTALDVTIDAASKALSNWVNRIAIAKERAADYAKECENIKRNLDSLGSTIQANEAQIIALNSTENPTAGQTSKLNSLKNQNQDLTGLYNFQNYLYSKNKEAEKEELYNSYNWDMKDEKEYLAIYPDYNKLRENRDDFSTEGFYISEEEYFQQAIRKYKELNEKKKSSAELTKMEAAQLQVITTNLETIGAKYAEMAINESFNNEDIKKFTEYTRQLSDALDPSHTLTAVSVDFKDALDHYISSLEYLTAVQKKVSAGNSLNYKEKQQLIESYSELVPYIKQTNDGWTVENEKLSNLINSTYTAAKSSIEELSKAKKEAIITNNAFFKSNKDELMAIDSSKAAAKYVAKNFFNPAGEDNRTNNSYVAEKIEDSFTSNNNTSSIINNKPNIPFRGNILNPITAAFDMLNAGQILEIGIIADREKDAKHAIKTATGTPSSPSRQSVKYVQQKTVTSKDLFNQEYYNLQQQLNRSEITQTQYFEKLREINNKYYKDKKEYLNDYVQYEKIVTEGLISEREKEYSNTVRDIDFQLKVTSRKEGTQEEQIQLNERKKQEAHKLADYYRQQNFSENSVQIQSAQSDYMTAEDSIKAIYHSQLEARLEEYQKYIDKRNDLNDWGTDNEIASLSRCLDVIKDFYSQGKISAEDYKNYIKKIYDQIENANQKAYEKEVSEVKEKYEQIKTAVITGINERIDALRDKLEQQNKSYDDQIKKLYEQKKLMQEQSVEADYMLKIQQARAALEKAQSQKNVQIYREGQGFVWETDQEAIHSAQQNYNDVESDYNSYQQQNAIDSQIDALQEMKVANTNSINAQIDKLQEYKEQWQDSTNLDDSTEKAKIALQELLDTFNITFDEMLDKADSFKEAYLKKLSGIIKPFDNSNSIYTPLSGKVYNANPDGTAPEGATYGDVIKTNGGNYRISEFGNDGDPYNTERGWYSVKIEDVAASADNLNQTAANQIMATSENSSKIENLSGDTLTNSDSHKLNTDAVNNAADQTLDAADELSDNTESTETNSMALASFAGAISTTVGTLISVLNRMMSSSDKNDSNTDKNDKDKDKNKGNSNTKPQPGQGNHTGLSAGAAGYGKKGNILFDIASGTLKQNEVPMVLTRGEWVLTPQQMDNLYGYLDSTVNSGIVSRIAGPSPSPLPFTGSSPQPGTSFGDIHIVMNGVNDLESFGSTIKNNVRSIFAQVAASR